MAIADGEGVVDLSQVREERQQLKARPPGIGGGGGGPHDPFMDARVSALEAAFLDMRVTLGRIDERTAGLARKEDVSAVGGNIATLTERVHALSERVGAIEGTLNDTVKTALSKTIGVGGGIALFGGIAAIVALAIGVLRFFHFL